MNSYLVLKVKNCNQTKIVQKLHNINVAIYKMDQINDDIYIKIRAEDYKKITKYLKTIEFYKYKYIGIEFFKQFIKKYQLIIIVFLISLLIIIFSSFFIVDIDIIHEDEALVEIIKNELDKYGIKKISIKKNYKSLQQIKKNIKNAHLDKIDWIEINKVGMKYIVRVEERIITIPKIKENYCSIYANKDGLVKKIKVFAGEGIVNINDYVKKGDILISGDIKRNEETVKHVCASGEVYAEVWYIVNIKIPLKYYENEQTGKKRKNIIINYNDVYYKLFKDRLNNYKISRKIIFDLLGIKIYEQTDMEIKKVEKKYTEQEAINKALKLANEKVKLKLGKDDSIISQKVLQNKTIDSTMDIDIFIVAEEQIGYLMTMKEDASDDI